MAQTSPGSAPHAVWVRVCHAVVALAVAALMVSGVEILMVHPRLYWGEAGNDLTTPILELPISRNHRHGGWTAPVAFFDGAASPVTASRTFEIFNMNGWGRSLHFLAGWCLVAAGTLYLLLGLATRHVSRHLVPQAGQRSMARLTREITDHLYLRIPAASGGPDYGLLQRLAYLGVIVAAMPLLIATGMTMSPAIVAAAPWLLDLFGGHQSARTIHFASFVALVLFVVTHLTMVVLSGFRRQVRAITVGGAR